MSAQPFQPTARLAVGKVAPDLPAQVSLGDHAATIVAFTSGGCPYALAWHGRIQQVARDHGGDGVQLVQIFSNDSSHRPEDSPENLVARAEHGQLEGLVVHDADQSLARAFGATATPEIFVLDREGVVRYHGAPDGNHEDESADAAWLRAALAEVLANRHVTQPNTSPAGCSIKWRVELRWWDGCPSHPAALELLEDTLDDLGRGDVVITQRQVARRREADELGFVGSPTFTVGGRDLFPSDTAPSLGCRIYAQPDGRLGPLPDAADLAARLRDALARPWDLPGWVDFRTTRKAESS